MNALPAALSTFGVQWEALPDWEAAGVGPLTPRGSVSHWTAGSRGTTTRPSLRVVRDGRTGLAGPLCNVYLDRYGIAVLVAAGTANHAGAGGYAGMSGNDSVYGIEAEGGPGDFTAAQLAAYPRLIAALHSVTDTDPARYACGHDEWTTRKIDIGDYMPPIRAEASRLWRLGGAPVLPEADMATPNEILMAEVWHTHADGSIEKHPYAAWITHMAQRSAEDHARLKDLESKIDALIEALK